MSTPSDTDVPTGSDADAPIETMQEDADALSSPDTEEDQQGGMLKSGVNAREAALARWSKERARQADETEAATHARQDEVLVVRTTVATGQILKRLEADAKKGSTQAARELRAWLAELPIETDTDISALDKRTRQALLARLLAEIEAEGTEDGIATPATQESAEEGATPPTTGTP